MPPPAPLHLCDRSVTQAFADLVLRLVEQRREGLLTASKKHVIELDLRLRQGCQEKLTWQAVIEGLLRCTQTRCGLNGVAIRRRGFGIWVLCLNVQVWLLAGAQGLLRWRRQRACVAAQRSILGRLRHHPARPHPPAAVTNPLIYCVLNLCLVC